MISYWQAVQGGNDKIDTICMPVLDCFVIGAQGTREAAPGEKMLVGNGAYEATRANDTPQDVSVVGDEGYPCEGLVHSSNARSWREWRTDLSLG